MAFIPTPNCAQVEINCSMNGQRTQWVLHYVINPAAPYTVASLGNLAAGIVTHLNVASVKSKWPSTMSVTGVRAIDMGSQTGPAVEASSGLPIQGTHAGASLPNNVALCLTKRTSNRGRSFRGRLYFGPLTETDVLGNIVDAAFVTSLIGNFANGFLTITNGATVHELVVLSRFNNGVPRSVGIPTNVDNWTSDGVIDSQRRRLPGRGA